MRTPARATRVPAVSPRGRDNLCTHARGDSRVRSAGPHSRGPLLLLLELLPYLPGHGAQPDAAAVHRPRSARERERDGERGPRASGGCGGTHVCKCTRLLSVRSEPAEDARGPLLLYLALYRSPREPLARARYPRRLSLSGWRAAHGYSAAPGHVQGTG